MRTLRLSATFFSPVCSRSEFVETISQGSELVVDDVDDQFAINPEVLVDHDVAQTRDRCPWHFGEAVTRLAGEGSNGLTNDG